ncbi:MAG: hypothetical protein ACK53Y_25670, partial [bacterium]
CILTSSVIFPSNTPSIILYPRNLNAAQTLGSSNRTIIAQGGAATQFILTSTTALVFGVAYQFNYQCF